jgi:hypothetical protein
MTGLLVKIGDVWVDPRRVEALEFVEAVPPDDDAEPAPTPTWIVDGKPFASVSFQAISSAPDGEPAYVRIHLFTSGDSYAQYNAHGVTLDEAAQIVNRCREQHMGRK